MLCSAKGKESLPYGRMKVTTDRLQLQEKLQAFQFQIPSRIFGKNFHSE